ncbi:MAG: hypothetical protein L3J16_05875, partial [Anaerolineales bacterium]|nr:hypothetical protein [Anaerolineales bacterium]
LTAGVLGLFIGIAAMPLIDFSLNPLIYGGVPVLISTSVIELGFDLASSALHGLTTTIIIYALIIAIFGLGMTIASVFVQPSTQIEKTH